MTTATSVYRRMVELYHHIDFNSYIRSLLWLAKNDTPCTVEFAPTRWTASGTASDLNERVNIRPIHAAAIALRVAKRMQEREDT